MEPSSTTPTPTQATPMTTPMTTPLPTTIAGKITTATTLKSEGNAFVQQHEYAKAIGRYTKVFAYINGLDISQNPQLSSMLNLTNHEIKSNAITKEESQQISALTISTNSNLALCYMHQMEWQKVIKCATNAIKLDATNAKLYYRRGSAYLHTNAIDNAVEDLETALKLAPTDTAIRAELQKAKQKLIVVEQKMRNQYKGMFERM
jgi:peptidyl-prolyl isomerase D